MMKVSRAGFYAWDRRRRQRAISASAQRRQALIDPTRQAFATSRDTYGSRRIAAELNAAGIAVCRNTVARLMRQEGLASVVRRRTRRFVPKTTDADHDDPIAANLLNRDFAPAAPNRKWAADITYIPTGQGWLFLAAVQDLFSRKIVGWNMDDNLKSPLVRDALRMARC
jgi:transposase InsO family protein